MKTIRLFAATAVLLAGLAACGGGSGGSGGGSGANNNSGSPDSGSPDSEQIAPDMSAVAESMTMEERKSAMERVAAKWPHTGDQAADDAAFVSYIETQPDFADAGLMPGGGVWARFKDGRPVTFMIDETTTATTAKVTGTQGVASIAAHARDAALQVNPLTPQLPQRDTVNAVDSYHLPQSSTAVILEAADDIPKSYGDEIHWLKEAGYNVAYDSPYAGTLDNMMNRVKDAGVLYISAHAAYPTRRDGKREYGMMLTDCGLGTPQADDLAAKDLLILNVTVREEDGAIASSCLIGKDFANKYWELKPDSLVVLFTCDAFGLDKETRKYTQPFHNVLQAKSGGRTTILGWAGGVEPELGDAAMKLFFDRVLGKNQRPPVQSSPPRPSPFREVYSWMKETGKDFDPRNPRTELMLAELGTNNGQLAPGIENLNMGTDLDWVELSGTFGPDPGAENRKVMLGATQLEVETWSGTLIKAKLPPNTDSGDVTVEIRGHKSNAVPTALVSPSSGAVGTVVTIAAATELTDFTSVQSVSIGNGTAIVLSHSASSLTAMVMPGASTGLVKITTATGATTAGKFTVKATGAPATQQAKLVGADAVGDSSGFVLQGQSVAVSADGNTAVVGGSADSSDTGAAWVYTRSGVEWKQQAKLVGTDAAGKALQGGSVAVSADGNTVVVGGWTDDAGERNGAVGAAWVYTRSGGVWKQQGLKLVGTGAPGNRARQGISVAVSADGNTVVVGGDHDGWVDSNGDGWIDEIGAGAGAAWVYTRSDGVWTQQAKIVGTGAVGDSCQGGSVALSADGNTAVVGGWKDDGKAGAVWVFTRSGGVWTQQGKNKLVGTDAVGKASQGGSVAVSADGNTLVVGGSGDNGGAGAVWVYTRSGEVWTQQATITNTSAVGKASQGGSVAVSADGNTIVVGGPFDNNVGGAGVGAVWVYTRSGGVWTQRGGKLVATGAVGYAGQGFSVALSADGNTAVVGGVYDNYNLGAAWVYTTP